MRLSCFPLKMIVDGRTVPSPVIVTAMVARLVSFVNVRVWMVFSNQLQRLFCAHQKIDLRLIDVEDETPAVMGAE